MNVFVIPGLVVGCVYAIAASGLVLTYSTTGVLNLSYGAIAYTAATLFYWLRSVENLNGWVALVICVIGFCPIVGIALWRYLFRLLVGTGLVPPLIASIGLAVALPAAAQWIFHPGQILLAPGVLNQGSVLHRYGGIDLSGDQLLAVIGAIVVAVGLFALFRFTTIGLQLRAVFDNRSVTALSGASPNRISTFSWVLAVSLAGLAGILLAPVLQLDPNVFLEVTVASLAAALVGGLRSISLTLVAALALGVLSSVVAGLDSGGGLVAQGIQPSLPFIVMVITLILRRNALEVGELPRVMKQASSRPRDALSAMKVSAVPLIAFVVLPFVLSSYWLGVVGEGFIFGLIFLSFSLALGDAGVIPLGQAAVVGISGFLAGLLAAHGVSLLFAVVIAALFASVIGIVLSLIGAGLGPLEFGFLTLAFGLFADNFLYNWYAFVPLQGANFASPVLFKWTLSTATEQYYLFGIALGIGCVGVWLFRRSIISFFVNASRLDRDVVQSFGVSARFVRTVAFGFACLLSGLGAGMLGIFQKNLGPSDVPTAVGLLWLAVIVCMGVRRPGAAVIAGLVYSVLPAIFSNYLPIGWGYLPTILFGLGGLGLASDPRGVVSMWQEKATALARITVAKRRVEVL